MNMIRFRITKYAKGAKINKNVTPHTLKHTYTTLLLEQDVDLQFTAHSALSWT